MGFFYAPGQHTSDVTVFTTHHENPFQAYSDWFAEEEDITITFQTMKHQLWDIWVSQCNYELSDDHSNGIEKVHGDATVDHSQFQPDDLKPPGINRETYPDDPDYVDEFYDIVVPHDFLHAEICEGWIARLNQQYDKDFELQYSQQG